MANLIDIITDYSPPASGVSVPLQSTVSITFDRLMDTSRLQEDFFIQGPDTDQFIGEGLIQLQYPENVSQGELDDFLRSPGYQGIVEGSFSFETTGSKTKLTFDPTLPLAPSIKYTATLAETLDADGDTISGFVSWWFNTGTGSIEQLPSSVSSSVLADAITTTASVTTPLAISKTTPADLAIEQDTDLSEIIIEFNKQIDSDSVSDKVDIKTIKTTDHPQASANAAGDLAKRIEVIGKLVKITI